MDFVLRTKYLQVPRRVTLGLQKKALAHSVDCSTKPLQESAAECSTCSDPNNPAAEFITYSDPNEPAAEFITYSDPNEPAAVVTVSLLHSALAPPVECITCSNPKASRVTLHVLCSSGSTGVPTENISLFYSVCLGEI